MSTFLNCNARKTAVAVCAAFAGALLCASVSAAPSQPMSRQFQQAIMVYKTGDYQAAMDRFMDILVNGSPAERAAANEYVNTINHKLDADNWELDNSSSETEEENSAATAQDEGSSMKEELSKTGSAILSKVKTIFGGPKAKKAPAPEQTEGAVIQNTERARQIERKMLAMRKFLTSYLSKAKGARLFMDGDKLRAINIDPDAVFSKGLKFKPSANNLLSAVAGLMYTYGNACFVVTPQGFTPANANITDMRKAMALNSYLIQKGISSARLFVNFGISAQDPLQPKFSEIKGIGITFDYERQPLLNLNDTGSAKMPPRVTLGVFPSVISPEKQQGAIVEFSAIETTSRIDYWRFQILSYDRNRNLTVVQETTGEDAAYHQIFWNGRKGFFGDALPGGKYLCVLSAVDQDGREKIARRVLTLNGNPAPLGKNGRGTTVSGKTSGGGATGVTSVTIRKGKAAAKAGGRKKKSASARTYKEIVANDTGFIAMSGRNAYTIRYVASSADMTTAGKTQIGQLADNMASRPDDAVVITGYASSSETDAQDLAEKRAQTAKDFLISEYGLDGSKIETKTEVNERAKASAVAVIGQK